MQAQTIVAAIHRVDNQVVLIPAPQKVIPVYRKRTVTYRTVSKGNN